MTSALAWCCLALYCGSMLTRTYASPNLAQGKPAWESTMYMDGAASRAVDGNKNANALGGSCSHTDKGDFNPWLAIDLRGLIVVQGVQVTNRADCCPERLNNFVVGLTNNAPATSAPNLNNVVICGRGPAVAAAGADIRVTCAAGLPAARYVVILNPQEYLTICELEVYGALSNVAQGKPSWESTMYGDGVASRAVDGNKNANALQGSCSHTDKGDFNPWLAIDLGQPTIVQYVEVTNRGDCCPERLNNFVVGLTNTAPTAVAPTVGNMAVCGRGPASAPAGLTLTVICAPNSPGARYVVITTPQEYLTICELAVYGTPVPACASNPCKNGGVCNDKDSSSFSCVCGPTFTGKVCELTLSNMARGKPSWESTMYGDGAASRAVDGNKNTNAVEGSCSHTDKGDFNPWLAVDLLQIANVQRVAITNRADCCPERLNNLVVGLTNTAPTVTRPTEANIKLCGRGPAAAGAGANIVVVCQAGLDPARYVTIMTPQEYLTICELEVWASAAGACASNPCKNGGQCSDTSTASFTCKCAMRWGGHDCGAALSNVAQGKPAWESTMYMTGAASRAVDGNKNTNAVEGSCSHTDKGDFNPWLAVDLGQPTVVQFVEVTNRGDCCPERLNNFVVGLTNTAPTAVAPSPANVVVCGRGPAAPGAGAAIIVQCSPGLAPARYVAIMTPQEYLTICELQVWGLATVVDPCASKPCQNGGACTKVSNSEFSCACVPGWTGTNCATEVNVCASSNPCKNGGKCVKFGASYECQCAANYAGTNCEMGSAQCKNVNAADRYNCGWSDITAAQCNERSCCFDSSIANTPWCFYATYECESLKDTERVNCGWDGIAYTQCTGRGCCFDDDEETNKGPVCYRKANPACVGVAAADRKAQGTDTIQPNECNAKGWCYDTTVKPYCFTRA